MVSVLEFLSHARSPASLFTVLTQHSNEWRSVLTQVTCTPVNPFTTAMTWKTDLASNWNILIAFSFLAIEYLQIQLFLLRICFLSSWIALINLHCKIRHHNTLTTCRYLYPNQKQILIGWFRRHELRSPGEFQPCQHVFSAFVETQHPEGEKTLVRDESLYSSYAAALSVFCLRSCLTLPRWLASDGCFQPSHKFHNLPLRFLLSSYMRSFCYMHFYFSMHASKNPCNASVVKSLAYCMLFTSSSDTLIELVNVMTCFAMCEVEFALPSKVTTETPSHLKFRLGWCMGAFSKQKYFRFSCIVKWLEH